MAAGTEPSDVWREERLLIDGVLVPARDGAMEPLISSRQRDRVLGYIETRRQEGASVACGGGIPAVFGSPERAAAVAARIRTGTVSVNNGLWFGPDVPFGGYKQSGIGREMGRAGFEEYLETKSIASPA